MLKCGVKKITSFKRKIIMMFQMRTPEHICTGKSILIITHSLQKWIHLATRTTNYLVKSFCYIKIVEVVFCQELPPIEHGFEYHQQQCEAHDVVKKYLDDVYNAQLGIHLVHDRSANFAKYASRIGEKKQITI